MEFAAICLRNALLLLPEHQQNDSKSDNGSKSCSQSGSTESCGETGDSCRYPTRTRCRFLHVLNRININNCINKHSVFNPWCCFESTCWPFALTVEKPRRETSLFLPPLRPPWESRRWRTSGEITVDCSGMNVSHFVMLRKQPGDFWNDCI